MLYGYVCVCVCSAEIEMVVMEKCRISDVSTLTEQNITDEEKSAAAARSEVQKNRYLDTHESTLTFVRANWITNTDLNR